MIDREREKGVGIMKGRKIEGKVDREGEKRGRSDDEGRKGIREDRYR